MIKETFTVHEALAEIKMLDKRLDKAISTAIFAVENKHNNTKVFGTTVDEFVDSAEKSYQSIMDMINRRKALRNAVAVSNATTKVVVAGTEYTVSELIEMRSHGIEFYNDLLHRMSAQLSSAKSSCNRNNFNLDAAADTFVANMLGGKEKIGSTDGMAMRQAYIEANTMEVVSISNIEERVNTLSEQIEKFNSEVDAKISISNALTVINIKY